MNNPFPVFADIYHDHFHYENFAEVLYICGGSPSESNLLIPPCPGEPVNWRKGTVYDGSILSVTGGGRCVQDWDARWINAVYYWGGQESRPSPSGSTLLAAYGE